MRYLKDARGRLTRPGATTLFLGGLLLGVLIFGVLLPFLVPGWAAGGATGDPFERPFPLPVRHWAENEEYYVFASGGQQGGIYVYSVPAMKAIAEIPVFTVDEAWGWTTEDPAVAHMLTNPWTGQLALRGDTRRPALSRTAGAYDGRWLFVSDMLHPRVARIDLATFRTAETLWLPEVNGGTGAIDVSPESDLLAVGFEHAQLPDAAIQEQLDLAANPLDGPYLGGFAGVRVEPEGKLSSAWQVWGPWSQDGLRIGWGASEGWLITTSYNSERATSTLQMLGDDEDFLFIWNLGSIEDAISRGDYLQSAADPNTRIVSWHDVEVYKTAVPVNPSGVDISPTGQYLLVGSKAASQLVVFDFLKMLEALPAAPAEDDAFGVPTLNGAAVRATTIDLGLGPSRVEFDDNGYAYVGTFVDSRIWKLAMGGPYAERHGETPWKVVDELESHFSVVQPMIPGGDSAQPYGRYLIAINKLAKNSFLPHGLLHADNHELFLISESPGQLIDQMPLGPETHGAQAIPVSLIAPSTSPPQNEGAISEEPRVEYHYDTHSVEVYMNVVRSFFAPDWFSVPEGWNVRIHLTSLEQARDISHGIAIDGYDVALSLEPGQRRDVEFTADRTGLHWFYCLWYCSELHKEMRGRMIVIPESDWSTELEYRS